MPRYITLATGIKAARLDPENPDQTTSAAVIAAAAFLPNNQTGSPARIPDVDFEGASVAVGEYDLVVRYATDDDTVPVRLSGVLSELVGGRSTTLTLVEDVADGADFPSERGLAVARDMQASGHDDAVTRAQPQASGHDDAVVPGDGGEPAGAERQASGHDDTPGGGETEDPAPRQASGHRGGQTEGDDETQDPDAERQAGGHNDTRGRGMPQDPTTRQASGHRGGQTEGGGAGSELPAPAPPAG